MTRYLTTVREINAACREQKGRNVYAILADGKPMRIIRARTVKGKLQLRCIYLNTWIKHVSLQPGGSDYVQVYEA